MGSYSQSVWSGHFINESVWNHFLLLSLCPSPDQFLLIKPLAICFSSCVWTCRSRSWSWRLAYGVTGNSRGPNTRICHVGLNVGWASVLLFWALASVCNVLGPSFCLQCFDWGFSRELLSSHPWSEIDGWSKLANTECVSKPIEVPI